MLLILLGRLRFSLPGSSEHTKKGVPKHAFFLVPTYRIAISGLISGTFVPLSVDPPAK
jgi:hypothetical protein